MELELLLALTSWFLPLPIICSTSSGMRLEKYISGAELTSPSQAELDTRIGLPEIPSGDPRTHFILSFT